MTPNFACNIAKVRVILSFYIQGKMILIPQPEPLPESQLASLPVLPQL